MPAHERWTRCRHLWALVDAPFVVDSSFVPGSVDPWNVEAVFRVAGKLLAPAGDCGALHSASQRLASGLLGLSCQATGSDGLGFGGSGFRCLQCAETARLLISPNTAYPTRGPNDQNLYRASDMPTRPIQNSHSEWPRVIRLLLKPRCIGTTGRFSGPRGQSCTTTPFKPVIKIDDFKKRPRRLPPPGENELGLGH